MGEPIGNIYHKTDDLVDLGVCPIVKVWHTEPSIHREGI